MIQIVHVYIGFFGKMSITFYDDIIYAICYQSSDTLFLCFLNICAHVTQSIETYFENRKMQCLSVA